jgi:hypothetical protein
MRNVNFNLLWKKKKLKKEIKKIIWKYIEKLTNPVEIYKFIKKNYEYLHNVICTVKINESQKFSK